MSTASEKLAGLRSLSSKSASARFGRLREDVDLMMDALRKSIDSRVDKARVDMAMQGIKEAIAKTKYEVLEDQRDVHHSVSQIMKHACGTSTMKHGNGQNAMKCTGVMNTGQAVVARSRQNEESEREDDAFARSDETKLKRTRKCSSVEDCIAGDLPQKRLRFWKSYEDWSYND